MADQLQRDLVKLRRGYLADLVTMEEGELVLIFDDDALRYGDHRGRIKRVPTQEEVDGKRDKALPITSEDLSPDLLNLMSGSPRGIFPTLQDLLNKYPYGAEGIYVVQADGHWYFWENRMWSDGGLYNATQVKYEQKPGIGKDVAMSQYATTLALNNLSEELKGYVDDLLEEIENASY